MEGTSGPQLRQGQEQRASSQRPRKQPQSLCCVDTIFSSFHVMVQTDRILLNYRRDQIKALILDCTCLPQSGYFICNLTLARPLTKTLEIRKQKEGSRLCLDLRPSARSPQMSPSGYLLSLSRPSNKEVQIHCRHRVMPKTECMNNQVTMPGFPGSQPVTNIQVHFNIKKDKGNYWKGNGQEIKNGCLFFQQTSGTSVFTPLFAGDLPHSQRSKS